MAAVECVMVPCRKLPKSLMSFNKGLLSGQDEETGEDPPSNVNDYTSKIEVPSADETENHYTVLCKSNANEF